MNANAGGRCMHRDFEAQANVSRLHSPEDTDPHAFVCDLTIWCKDCGASMGFRCPDVGMLPDRPAVNVAGTEIHLPLVSPSEMELLGPLAGLSPSTMPGFRVVLPGMDNPAEALVAALARWREAYPTSLFPGLTPGELDHAMELVNAEDPNQSARLYAEWARHIIDRIADESGVHIP